MGLLVVFQKTANHQISFIISQWRLLRYFSQWILIAWPSLSGGHGCIDSGWMGQRLTMTTTTAAMGIGLSSLSIQNAVSVLPPAMLHVQPIGPSWRHVGGGSTGHWTQQCMPCKDMGWCIGFAWQLTMLMRRRQQRMMTDMTINATHQQMMRWHCPATYNANVTAMVAHDDRRNNLCRMMTDHAIASQGDGRC